MWRTGGWKDVYKRQLSEQSGFQISDDGDLMSLLTRLAAVKAEYDKVAGALQDAVSYTHLTFSTWGYVKISSILFW